jgi:hypothetical protein
MIKVFDKSKEYETYSLNGINSGELCYVKEDKSAHFRTNNIDGSDKTYNMSEGEGGSANLTTLEVTENGTYNTTGTDYDGYSEVTVNVAAPTPEYTTVNLNTFDGNGSNFSTMITATVGKTIEVYNPNHLFFQVGQGQPNINPSTGESDGYVIYQNGIASYDYINDSYLEHLYVTNAPNTMEGGYSDYGFCIGYYSQAGTPVNGVIYYRVF